MEDNIFDKVHEVDLKKTMEQSYMNYSMSVITARAIPDARDGLKPVQRRVLYDMSQLHLDHDKPHRKSARIVGDTMGKYHPHGDSSIYDTLVVMSQEFKKGMALVDGHGNFGSIEGDGAAAMRYTEARLEKICQEVYLKDLDKTVNFVPNYDETEKEPTVLPSRYPNIKIIDNRIEEGRDTEIEEILKIVKGPDFPTGAQILGTRGIEEAYRTGRGKIRVRAVTNMETLPNGKTRIIVTELPYLVNRARLIEKIADLVKEKKIDGITALTDESSREGMRINIELRRDVNANVILNQLYKHTQLQDTFGVIMLALYNNQPVVMNLLQMLTYYLKHQEEVVTRRTRYDLNKAEERAHILQGLLIALDNIDEVIRIIRGSRSAASAKESLMERFTLTDVQAQAIVDMRLRALTGLEREKIENEYAELQKKISELKAILADENLLLGVIKKELEEIRDKYADPTRSDFSMEDLIPQEEVVVTMTKLDDIKRMTRDNFKSQNRGGKGIKGMQTLDDDYIEELILTNTHASIMFFTNKGRVYRLKTYEIPEASRTARGTAIINLLQLQPEETITSIVTMKEYRENAYLFMATKNGMVKKTSLDEYQNMRKTGLTAINLREDDELIEVKYTDGDQDIFLVTKYGQCIRFHESDVRATGRASMGVIGINLMDTDEVVGMQLSSQGEYMLTVSENGMGKLTDINEFTVQNRGGKGIKCYKIVEKTGNVVDMKILSRENEVMMINTDGIIIQMPCSDISILGRVTSGVKLMDLKNGITIASIAKVRESSKNENEEEASEESQNETENAGEETEE